MRCGPCGGLAVIQRDVGYGHRDGFCASCAETWCSRKSIAAAQRALAFLKTKKETTT